MLRKIVSVAVMLVLCVSVVMAGEYMGVITKVDGGKVTFTEMKGKEKGDTKTFSIAKDVKVVTGKFDKETKKVVAGDPLEGGLKNELFTKIGEKGVRAQIVTDKDDKAITSITVLKGGKKGKDK